MYKNLTTLTFLLITLERKRALDVTVIVGVAREALTQTRGSVTRSAVRAWRNVVVRARLGGEKLVHSEKGILRFRRSGQVDATW